MSARNYEAPTDANLDNVYQVQITATRNDGVGYSTATQTISVTILDAHLVRGNLSAPTTNGASSSAQLATWNHVVESAANRVLVVSVSQQGSSTDPGGLTSLKATLAGTDYPLTKLTETGPQIVSTRAFRGELWYLLNPPVGTLVMTPVKANTSTLVRTIIQGVTLTSAAQIAPPDVMTPVVDTNATLNHAYAGSLTTTSDDETVVGMYFTEVTSGTSPSTLPSGMDTNSVATASAAAQYIQGLFTQEKVAAGSAAFSFLGQNSGTAGACRYGALLAAAFKSVPYQAQDPIYYVDAVSGSDAADGYSPATAWKTLAKIEALSPLAGGSIVNLKAGQVHRRGRAPATATETMLSLATGASATALQPVILTRYGTGTDPLIAGDIVYSTGWVAATDPAETNTTAVGLGVQKRPMGTTKTDKIRSCFPCIDSLMHHPCMWSPASGSSGWPTSIYAWDDSFPGGDSFHYPTTIQAATPAPSAMDGTSEVQCSYDGANWSIKITNPAIAAHYGAVSPVGAFALFRVGGNLTYARRITAYDQAGSSITITYAASTTFGPHPTFFWSIQGHPLDLRQQGQFAWSLDDSTIYVIWRTSGGAQEKSIAKYATGASLSGNYWKVQNVQFGRTAAEGYTGTPPPTFLGTGDNGVLSSCSFRQCINPDRPMLLNIVGSGWNITNTVFDEAKTHSGLRVTGMLNSTVDGVVGRNLGRTLIYHGSGGGNLIKNVDGCEHVAVHGNGFTEYQDSRNITHQYGALFGSQTPMTSQTKDMPYATYLSTPKSVTRKNIILSQPRHVGTTVPGVWDTHTPLDRVDEGDTNSHWDRCVMVLGYTQGLSLGDQQYANTSDAAPRGNSGALIERCVLFNILGQDGISMSGVTVKDCLILAGDATAITAQGGTSTNNLFGAVTGDTWNGCLTANMQKVLTTNDARTGYEDIQLGPTAWGWIIPAYGSAFTLKAINLSSTTFPAKILAGKQLASVYGTMPGSTVALGTGHDNASFALDKGVLIPLVSTLSGTYTIDLVETNAAASGGTTRTTTLTLTFA
jgi:hypothetical protein